MNLGKLTFLKIFEIYNNEITTPEKKMMILKLSKVLKIEIN